MKCSWRGRYVTVSDAPFTDHPLREITRDDILWLLTDAGPRLSGRKATLGIRRRVATPTGSSAIVDIDPDYLPDNIGALLTEDNPHTNRSDDFARLVWYLASRGNTEPEIVQLFERHSTRWRVKYAGRLAEEVHRSFDKYLNDSGTKSELSPTLPHPSSVAMADAATFDLWRPVGTFDEAAISKLHWVHQHLAPRGKVTVMAGPGGTGKTTIAVAMAVSVAANETLLDLKVYSSGGAAYCLLEDDEGDLLRSVAACLKQHKLYRRECRYLNGSVTEFQTSLVRRTLHIYGNRPGMEAQRLVIVTRDRYGNIIPTPIVETLVAKLIDDGIDLLVIDPFKYSHTLDENSNEDIAEVMRRWSEVARRANCAVLLLHHFRKGGATGVAEMRGASALSDHARAALPLSTMTSSDHTKFGLTEPAGRFVRIDDPKLNYQARPEETIWFRLVEVELDNGDTAVAAERWYPPAVSQKEREKPDVPLTDDLRSAIERGLGDGEFYTPHRNARERWIGRVVMDHVGVDELKATAVVKAWLEQGLLRKATYHSPSQRRGVPCVRVAAPSNI